MNQNETMHSIKLPRKVLQPGLAQRYRVYKTPKEYITVEASTASEAFRLSELVSCFRIVKETVVLEDMLGQSLLQPTSEYKEIAVGDADQNLGNGRKVDGVLVIHAPSDGHVESVSADQLFKAFSLADMGKKKPVQAEEVAVLSVNIHMSAPATPVVTDEPVYATAPEQVTALPEPAPQDVAFEAVQAPVEDMTDDYESMIVYSRTPEMKKESHLVPKPEEAPMPKVEKRELTQEEIERLLNDTQPE